MEDLSSKIKAYVLSNYSRLVYGHNVYHLLQTGGKKQSLTLDEMAEYWGKLKEEQVIRNCQRTLGVKMLLCCTLTSKQNRNIKSTPDAVVVKGWQEEVLVEIECPIFVGNMGKIKSGKYLQMQTHMFCNDSPICLFVQWYPSHCHFHLVYRNATFFDKVLLLIQEGRTMEDYVIQDQCKQDSVLFCTVTPKGVDKYCHPKEAPWEKLKIDYRELFSNSL